MDTRRNSLIAFVSIVLLAAVLLTYVYARPYGDDIILEWRWERGLQALALGFLLAPAGYVLQTVCSNPLADPFTLGISSVALLGGVLGLSLGSTLSFFPAWVVLGAAGSLFFLLLYTRGTGAIGPKLILAGVILGFFSSSLIHVLTSRLGPDVLVRTHQLMSGDLGRFSTETGIIHFAIAVVIVLLQIIKSKDLDRMSVGLWRKDNARWLLSGILLTLTIQITLAVIMVGIVGFLGLLIPHLIKFTLRTTHFWGLVFSCLWGASLALLSDLIGQSFLHPIAFSHICILWGAPVFLYLLARRKGVA